MAVVMAPCLTSLGHGKRNCVESTEVRDPLVRAHSGVACCGAGSIVCEKVDVRISREMYSLVSRTFEEREVC